MYLQIGHCVVRGAALNLVKALTQPEEKRKRITKGMWRRDCFFVQWELASKRDDIITTLI